eukprot:431760-Pelagomonas_calceolata.AAC.1
MLVMRLRLTQPWVSFLQCQNEREGKVSKCNPIQCELARLNTTTWCVKESCRRAHTESCKPVPLVQPGLPGLVIPIVLVHSPGSLCLED